MLLCIRYTDIPDEQDPDLVGVGGPPPALVGLWHSCSLATHPSLNCLCHVSHTASRVDLTQACIKGMNKIRQQIHTKCVYV